MELLEKFLVYLETNCNELLDFHQNNELDYHQYYVEKIYEHFIAWTKRTPEEERKMMNLASEAADYHFDQIKTKMGN